MIIQGGLVLLPDSTAERQDIRVDAGSFPAWSRRIFVPATTPSV